MESHTLRVTITLRKVFLTVRFPCTLSFQVKAGNYLNKIDRQSFENKTTYELQKG